MTLSFDVSEAFMAVGIAIISADERCTAKETAMMLEMFKTLNLLVVPPEEDYEEAWEALFDRTLGKINEAFPERHLSLSDAQLIKLIAAIKKSIGEETETLFRLAVAVAIADGIDPRELAIIKQLRKVLKISPERARQIAAESKAIVLKS